MSAPALRNINGTETALSDSTSIGVLLARKDNGRPLFLDDLRRLPVKVQVSVVESLIAQTQRVADGFDADAKPLTRYRNMFELKIRFKGARDLRVLFTRLRGESVLGNLVAKTDNYREVDSAQDRLAGFEFSDNSTQAELERRVVPCVLSIGLDARGRKFVNAVPVDARDIRTLSPDVRPLPGLRSQSRSAATSLVA